MLGDSELGLFFACFAFRDMLIVEHEWNNSQYCDDT